MSFVAFLITFAFMSWQLKFTQQKLTTSALKPTLPFFLCFSKTSNQGLFLFQLQLQSNQKYFELTQTQTYTSTHQKQKTTNYID